ncbi:NADH-quinone oxidoreductase subunit N [Ekhidna sp.]|uniref:NADH-quinone oxidoreductase subunit N n=1 Tax=Ekhidna sp. TaxID=2608089 RepID=UPI003512E9A7
MSLIEQLNSILNELQGVWTETALMLGAIVTLLVGLIKRLDKLVIVVYLLSIVVSIALNYNNTLSGSILSGSLALSSLSSSFGFIFLIIGGLLPLFGRAKQHRTEFFFFILAMLVGSLFIMKANNLLIIYLAIELVSFCSYILTNFTFKEKSFEAGIKYLLFGAICSATMLFGLGMIYGATGTIQIRGWNEVLFSGLFAQVGFVLFLVGIFFKISLAPAHLWVPATYQEAPADAAAFMSIVPKLAALVLLQRLFNTEIFSDDHWVLRLVFALGMLTIIAGTLGAFKQRNARRMIGFGAIAHSGFLLPFALLQTTTSSDAFWYYSLIYGIMNFAAFFMLDRYEKTGIYEVADYNKSHKETWIGVVFSLILVSLVGLPPLAGFTAKFFLFSTLWESGLMMYLVVALLATVGSLFFYFRIPKSIFLSAPVDDRSINFNFSTKILATLFCIVLLLLFFVPQMVMEAQQLLNNVHE